MARPERLVENLLRNVQRALERILALFDFPGKYAGELPADEARFLERRLELLSGALRTEGLIVFPEY